MSTEENASENRSVAIEDEDVTPYHVVDVCDIGDFCLELRFRDGLHGSVNLKPFLFATDAGVFESLRDPLVFNKVHIENDTVTWPGEIDLAPDGLYEDIKASDDALVTLE